MTAATDLDMMIEFEGRDPETDDTPLFEGKADRSDEEPGQRVEDDDHQGVEQRQGAGQQPHARNRK